MIRLNPFYIISVFILVANGANAEDSSPSQNPQLNAITPSGKIDQEKKGFIQRHYDAWEKEDWEPNTRPSDQESTGVVPPAPAKSSETIKVDTAGEKTPAGAMPEPPHAGTSAEPAAQAEPPRRNEAETASDAPGAFTLQYYIDKWRHYLDEKEKQSTGPSHSEKLEKMPGIGK